MCRGHVSPGGYRARRGERSMGAIIKTTQVEAAKVTQLALRAAARLDDGRGVGAAVLASDAMGAIDRAAEGIGEARATHRARHGAMDVQPECIEPARRPESPRTGLSVAVRLAREAERCIARACAIEDGMVHHMTDESRARQLERLLEASTWLSEAREVLIAVVSQLSSNPGAMSAIEFRRRYESPAPMYLRVFDGV